MRILIRAGVALAILTAPVLVHASDALKSIVGSYLQIQSALAADTIDGVKPAAVAIGAQAARMGPEGEPILKAAKAVEQSADTKAARQAFGDLSDAVIAAARAQGWSDLPDAKVAYCPMVKRFWVQTGEQIRNPYYGARMLTCGEFKKR